MRVTVYTGSRSEYGLLLPVLRALHTDPEIDLQILIGGSHTDPRHGLTGEQVHADGFSAAVAYSLWQSRGDGCALKAQASEVGVQLVGVAEALESTKPDWLLVYGDRAEALGAAVAAHYQRIKIAHLEAGDVTAGGMPDDRTRWAITMLAELALTTNYAAESELEQNAWSPPSAFVGLPSLDLLRNGDHDDPRAIADALRLDPRRPVVLVAENPMPGEDSSLAWKAAEAIGAQVLRTTPNADPGNEAIAEGAMPPMTPGRYYGLLKALAQHPAGACMAGNSSSAIKEAWFVGLPAVDVGERQRGRLKPATVIHAPRHQAVIEAALRGVLSVAPTSIAEGWSEYGDGTAGRLVVEALKGASKS